MNPKIESVYIQKTLFVSLEKSERYGRKLLEKIKKEYSKKEHQFISVDEFCQFTGLKVEQVQLLIID
jgi:hypothetical protein